MITFPNCKINIGLRILPKRDDGYHNIETIFYPLAICDAVEIVSTNKETIFTTSGTPISNTPAENLCLKAYILLKKYFPQLPNVHIHLHKRIPTGAGLGGGSADAAFVLKIVNNFFSLNLSQKKLMELALHLGSDCPFFILNTPCFAHGRGEQLSPIPLDMSAFQFVVVHPNIHVATALAFANITPSTLPTINLKMLVQQPITQWNKTIVNDFENTILKTYPPIAVIKAQLYDAGAVYASMTGSGSAVYGIFEKGNIPNIKFHQDYFVQYTT